MLSNDPSSKVSMGELSPWHRVDSVRCINLKSRPDRRRDATIRFEKVGLGDKVDFFITDKSDKGPFVGCYESHRACIEEAYNQGHKTLLVFEDDIVFNDGWEQVVRDCLDIIRKSGLEEVDVVQLGGRILHIHADYGALWKGSMLLAHAYIMTRQGMEKFLNRMPHDYSVSYFSRIPHDQAWGLILPNMFIHKSGSIIDQAWGDTDNHWFATTNIKSTTANWMQTKLSRVVLDKQSKLIERTGMLPLWMRHFLIQNLTPVAFHQPEDNTVRVSKGGLSAKLSVAIILLFSLFTVDAPPLGFFWSLPAVFSFISGYKRMSNSIKCGTYDVTTIHRAMT